MSTGITSCCTPRVTAPATPQQPIVNGGGTPAEPITSDDASAGAGVEGGGDTAYDAPTSDAPSCGRWVPAPVAVEDEQQPISEPDAPVGGGDTPPDPTPITGGSVPSSQLPTWSQWQQHFTRLGLGQEDVAKLGAANLTDQQLAQVYVKVRDGIVVAGGTPGVTPVPGSTASGAWDADWDQRFAALGLPAELVAAIKAEAQRTGADDAKIQAVYESLVEQPTGSKGSAWRPEWDQRFAALGLPADLIADIKSEAYRTGADDATIQRVYDQVVAKVKGGSTTSGPQPTDGSQPGWSAEFEQAFRALGMPDDVIATYAQSGAPASGLEKAYEHAKGRVEDFAKRGWTQKFEDAGVPSERTWLLILGPTTATDEQCEEAIKNAKRAAEPMWLKGVQLGASLFPGGRLLQYAFGHKVTGEKIDRTDPMEIGMAALSGVAAFMAIRGGKNVLAGIKARNGNMAALNGVGDTLGKLGLPKGGQEAVEQAALGATQTWGFKQKLLSWIPGTRLHSEVVGLGHTEAAARAFNAGGAAKILANDADGALQLATLTQGFDDLKSGAMRLLGGKNAYLQLKNGPLMTLGGAAGNGSEVVTVAKKLGIGNGNSQLVGLMEVLGKKLGQNPEWLAGSANLVDDIAQLSAAQRGTLGSVMAGNLARDLTGAFSKDGARPMRAIAQLAKSRQPEWYTALADVTKSQSQVGRAQDAIELLSTGRFMGGLFDQSRSAIASLDRTGLSTETGKLVDDVAARLNDADDALRAGTAAGRLGDDYRAASSAWQESLVKLAEHDKALAAKVMPIGDASTVQLAAQARSQALADWSAHVAAGGSAAVDNAAAGAATTVTRSVASSGAPAAAAASAAAAAAPAASTAASTSAATHADSMLAQMARIDQMTAARSAAATVPTRPTFAQDPLAAMEAARQV